VTQQNITTDHYSNCLGLLTCFGSISS